MATLSEQGVVPDAKRRLRLGGLVLDGSVRHFRNSTEMEFVVTDLATELVVRYRGALPDLFREGHSVVVEGFLRPGEPESPGEAVAGQLKAADPSISKQTGLGMEGQTAGGERVGGCHFAATEVLAKHDEVRGQGWVGLDDINVICDLLFFEEVVVQATRHMDNGAVRSSFDTSPPEVASSN